LNAQRLQLIANRAAISGIPAMHREGHKPPGFSGRSILTSGGPLH
jgi:hypothetical protein